MRDGVVTPSTGATCGTAPAGTLLLEFRAVARLAGRPDLEDLAMRSWQALGKATGRVKGLTPSKLKMTPSGCAAQFVFGNQSKLTVGSGVDSYYEYLLKGWLQEGGQGRPPQSWRAAVEAVDAHLVQVRGPTTFMADIEKNKTLGNRATHLACFWPGLRALEAIADPRVASTVLPLAEKLLDACVAAYDATPTNLAPEAWHVNDDGSVKLGANQRHLLRPETIESVFWMYRATRKKQKWLDAAARLAAAIGEGLSAGWRVVCVTQSEGSDRVGVLSEVCLPLASLPLMNVSTGSKTFVLVPGRFLDRALELYLCPISSKMALVGFAGACAGA